MTESTNKIIVPLSLDECIIKYVGQAVKQSKAEGSYGVGGILMNIETGELIKIMHNTVIAKEDEGEEKRLKDPTAHGERQMIDWYYANKNKKNLPPKEKILLITSLDPCCMCTGSILTAGFKTIVIALDDTAGINFDNANAFLPLEGEVGEKIKNTFIYPKVVGDDKRVAFGEVPYFTSKTICEKSLKICVDGFTEGAKNARKIIGDILPLSEMIDITCENSEIANKCKARLIEAYPNALEYRAKISNEPDEALAEYLLKAAAEDKANGGGGDAVALLDCFGNLLMCKPGEKDASLIRTALMETIREYQKVRYDLTAYNKEALKYLPEPKYCTLVLMKGFDKGTQSFADLGAYGSVIFGGLNNPTNLQYVFPRISQTELDEYISKMPPRYKKLIKPIRVKNVALIEKCKAFE